MKTQHKKIYETFADRGKLVFKITEGSFAGVSYTYDSMMLNGELKYKLKSNKSAINESNKILFEQEIQNILRDKLASLKS